MSADRGTSSETRTDPVSPLEFSLDPYPSTLKAAGGGNVRFPRAILALKNKGHEPVREVTLQGTVSQEGGLTHEITESLSTEVACGVLGPGETRQWDLFDLLAAGHPGVASKIHLFGYKAVLNWWFDLTVGADYRIEGESLRQETPPFRARFRWNAQPGALDQVGLSIERR